SRRLMWSRGFTDAATELAAAEFNRPRVRRPRPRQSKAELRAETEALVAQWQGQTEKVPTQLDVVCPRCHHRATVVCSLPAPRLPRSRCHYRHPFIAGRDPLQQWAAYRR